MLRVCSAAAVIPALSALEIRLYSTLALLHDVGKRAIPQEILNKPGSLTQEEFSIMKSHTTQGCDLLEKIPELRECEAFPLICDVCRHHHERWDGSGYPAGMTAAAEQTRSKLSVRSWNCTLWGAWSISSCSRRRTVKVCSIFKIKSPHS